MRRPMPNPDSFYSPEAYHPKCVPDQPPAEKQPWLRRFGSMRLPWGSSQDIVPPSVLTSVKPASLRLQEERDRIRDEQKSRGEYKPKPFEHIDLHDLLDHERIRHAQFPASSKFWMYMQMLGKGFSCITIPLILFSFLITEDYSHPNWPSELANTLLTLSAFIFAPLLAMWGGRLTCRLPLPQTLDKTLQRPSLGIQPPHWAGHCLRLRQSR